MDMLFMMSGILCLSALPCSVCGIGTLPCSVLLTTPCSCSCGSVTLWEWHTSSRIVSEVLGALNDAPDDASISSSSAQAAG